MKNGQSIENGVTNTEYLERNEGAINNGQSIENGVTNTEYLERNEGAIKNGQSRENGKIGNTRTLTTKPGVNPKSPRMVYSYSTFVQLEFSKLKSVKNINVVAGL
jgi:hypothetical protein